MKEFIILAGLIVALAGVTAMTTVHADSAHIHQDRPNGGSQRPLLN